MLLAEPDDVLFPRERLAAGEEVHVNTEFLALADDVAQLLVAHGQGLAVICRPAADTAKVTGGRRVHQNGPGHVAAVFFTQLCLLWGAYDVGVYYEVLKHGLQNVAVYLVEDVHYELVHVVVRVL